MQFVAAARENQQNNIFIWYTRLIRSSRLERERRNVCVRARQASLRKVHKHMKDENLCKKMKKRNMKTTMEWIIWKPV